MKAIQDLFYHHKEATEPSDTPEVIEAHKRFMDLLRTVPQCSEEFKHMAEDLFLEASLQNEKQGFVRGFQYAMQIAGDCGIGGAK